MHFPENINESDFDIETISHKEIQDKTMRYMRAYYDLCFEEFDLNKKGFFDKAMWCTWKNGMEVAFTKPAFQQAWKKIKGDTGYSKDFRQFVKQAMRKNPA